jgi:hypothetical protein
MNTVLWNMDSGLAAARRPGMTALKATGHLNGGARSFNLGATPSPFRR